MAASPVDVSVIIPVYEDPVGIRRTLAAVTRQTAPASAYEVVVVDNGSADETPAVVSRFVSEHPDLVTLTVEDEIQGSYAARNAGIRAAEGEILAFLDADMTVDRSWVATVRETMADGEHNYVGFAVEIVPSDPESIVAAYNRQTEFPVEQYVANDDFAPTCCLAVRREVVETVGVFDDRMRSSGDAEFGRRVAEAGFEQYYEPAVKMYHPARSTRELLAKHFRIGRGFRQREVLHPERFDHRPLFHPRNLIPPLSPFRLRSSAKQVRSESSVPLGIRGLIVFYLLSYMLSLAVIAGRAYERRNGEQNADRTSARGSQQDALRSGSD